MSKTKKIVAGLLVVVGLGTSIGTSNYYQRKSEVAEDKIAKVEKSMDKLVAEHTQEVEHLQDKNGKKEAELNKQIDNDKKEVEKLKKQLDQSMKEEQAEINKRNEEARIAAEEAQKQAEQEAIAQQEASKAYQVTTSVEQSSQIKQQEQTSVAVQEAPSNNENWHKANRRMIESTNNYNTFTGNGYLGAYQFAPQTWNSIASSHGLDANDFSPANQDKMADIYATERYGSWSNVPTSGGW